MLLQQEIEPQVSALYHMIRPFWDLEKTVLHEICVSRTVLSPLLTQKSPHLLVQKPKTVVLETVLVIFV